ncbi:MAG: bifunctional glutamate N-acetyltransferase/amino-acid acetyltransferase ArgJ [Desulfobacteraceae bacterium]|nr:bifunctional glutamate N-acetyltransferase/amino-acid acetyltransferase ArgJ [Desulfobacteraceae bacterium]
MKNVTVSRYAFEIPGFRTAVAASGMRYKGRTDLALIVSDNPSGCTASGVFTRNCFCAAPVEVCREHLAGGRAKAVIANAGIANACTGEDGKMRSVQTARLVAKELGCEEDSVLVASTGVIGMQLPTGPIAEKVPELVASLTRSGWEDAARAIMTTDLVPKMASARVVVDGKTITVGGIAKGSGMIAPDMATLLVFVCTDASVSSEVLDHWTRAGAEDSFNSITVDGDTSTNDTLIVLAGGAAGNPTLTDIDGPSSVAFGEALGAVLRDLAIQVVMDGEGATKLIEIDVTGAKNRGDARTVALTVSNSPLVKTAFFGQDANWGRIVAAAGRAGVDLQPENVTLYFEDLCVFRGGTPVLGQEVEERASEIFKQKDIRVRLDLGMGNGAFTAYTCDFSFDYVKINASYRS